VALTGTRTRRAAALGAVGTLLALALALWAGGEPAAETGARSSGASAGRASPDRAGDTVDWGAARDEAAALLARLVRIDTSNPPGDEAPAAELLAGWLRARGVRARVLPFAPGRANLVARLPATASPAAEEGPILLLAHLDVVPAAPEAWSFPPFSGAIRDGAVHGRGTLDDKGQAAVFATALALLAADAQPRRRALVLAATGGEEVDGAGVRALLDDHPELLGRPWVVWNEGGAAAPVALAGGRVVNGIAVAEKRALWLELVARGEGGHGAQPARDGAVERLARAAARVATWETPLRVTDTVAAQLRALAPTAAFPPSCALSRPRPPSRAAGRSATPRARWRSPSWRRPSPPTVWPTPWCATPWRSRACARA